MSVSIQLHPLTVLNISDHLTRAKYLTDKGQEYRVIGVLLGKQTGRSLDVCNSLELVLKGKVHLDDAFCRLRLEAYKKLFPDLDPIGWYSAGSTQTDFPSLPIDSNLHKQFQQFTESPLYAVLNPDSVEAKKKKILPLYIYEQEVATGGAPLFVRVDYSLATEDSERIAVDNFAKA
jgi:COP9 signalosome complex subunit 6